MISSVGQLLGQEALNLNRLYEDDDLLAFCHTLNGKHHIHTEFKVPVTKDILKKCMEVSLNIDVAFRKRGVMELWTWSEDGKEDQERFAVWLGYVPTGVAYNITGYDGIVHEYMKDLT